MLSLRISDPRPNVEVAHDSPAHVVTLEFQPDVPPLIPRYILQNMIDSGSLHLVTVSVDDVESKQCSLGDAVTRTRVESASQVRLKACRLQRQVGSLLVLR